MGFLSKLLGGDQSAEKAAKDLLNGLLVPFFGRSDEVIIGDFQGVPQGGEFQSNVVYELLRSNAFRFGVLGDFLTVFIEPG